MGLRFIDVCRETKVKLYVHVHGFDVSRYVNNPVWQSDYRRLFEFASGIIAPSRFLADKLANIGCPEERLHVNPNGVDPQYFRPAPGVPFRLLSVGRFVEKKAPQLTIRTVAKVIEQLPETHLEMIGDGPLLAPCKAIIRELGLAEKVRLLGARPSEKVAENMREASLFVQHSVTGADGNTEGLPVAILEAMASALPVVATKHNGIPEIVVEGETGLLVDEHDVPGMTRAIASLLVQPEIAFAMGQAARKRVLTHFDQKRTADRLRSILGLAE